MTSVSHMSRELVQSGLRFAVAISVGFSITLTPCMAVSDVPVDPALLQRIEPAGKVSVAGGAAAIPASTADGGSADGKAAYDKVCMACHSSGAAGAPKVGDKNAWAGRISQGMPTLYDHAIKGFQGKSGMLMPPKGGSDLSDAAVKAAVDYMVKASQ